MTPSVARTARDRAREEIRREIREEARRQLGEVGPDGLSLRSVARAVGMVSSAVYRYYPSRDELLTALIVEAYDAMGAAVELADAACARDDLFGRWLAACAAARAWAAASPHEYALIYGTPVPGYHAPSDRTVPPATRVTNVLTGILRDGVISGRLAYRAPGTDPRAATPLAPGYRHDLERVRAFGTPEIPEELFAAGFSAWTLLFGAISFDLFGRLDNLVDDRDGYFADQVAHGARTVGLLPS